MRTEHNDWVLPVYRYDGLEPLLATLAERVIVPAEAKVKALEERRRVIEAELTKASTQRLRQAETAVGAPCNSSESPAFPVSLSLDFAEPPATRPRTRRTIRWAGRLATSSGESRPRASPHARDRAARQRLDRSVRSRLPQSAG
jgi:hypothetical protein